MTLLEPVRLSASSRAADKLQNALAGRVKIPKTRSFRRWFAGRRPYRGCERRVVGYEWTRPYSHFMNGIVYEAVVGWGDTYDEAITRAVERTKLPTVGVVK